MCATGRTKTDYLQIDAIGKLKVTSLQIPLWFEDFLRPPPPSPHNPPPLTANLSGHTRVFLAISYRFIPSRFPATRRRHHFT